VDKDGVATLAATATKTVTRVSGWVGRPIPGPIKLAIKLLGQFYYEQGSVVDQPLPRAITALLAPYRNLVS